jgi:hypothetical protein
MIDMHKTMSQFASTDDYYKSIIADLKAAPIYVVHAKRWGEDESHSYIVVATTREIDAFAAAEFTEYQRGGKYGCEISCFNCGEKTIIRKPYDGKQNCYSCEHGRERTGLICQGCKSFSNWSKRT